jgi:hypothetical protein
MLLLHEKVFTCVHVELNPRSLLDFILLSGVVCLGTRFSFLEQSYVVILLDYEGSIRRMRFALYHYNIGRCFRNRYKRMARHE